MDHSYFKDRISAYLDQGLPPYEQAAVDEHLKDCQECRELLARLESLNGLVEKHSQLDGEDYWEKSARKIDQRLGIGDTRVIDVRPQKRGWGLGWKWVTAAASAAVLTFIGLHQTDIVKDRTLEPTLIPQETVTRDTTDLLAPVESELPAEPTPEAQVIKTDRAEVQTEPPLIEQAGSGALTEDKAAPAIAAPRPVPEALGDGRTVDDDENYKRPQDAGSKQSAAAPPLRSLDALGAAAATAPSETLSRPKSILQTGLADDESVSEVTDELFEIVTIEEADYVPGTDDSLAYWRQKRHSVLSLMRGSDEDRPVELSTESPALESVALPARKRELPQQAPTRDLEKQLMEACYQVARLSPDSTEVRRAMGVIEAIAADSASFNRTLAKQYLTRLQKD